MEAKKINVVMKGLKPTPELKKELEILRDNITSVIENEERHLADVGVILSSYSNQLKSISKRVFIKHAEIRYGITPNDHD